jgi:hypothetical protein
MLQLHSNGPGRLVVALAIALGIPAHDSPASTPREVQASETATVICEGAIQHPLDVRVTPLDAIAPGANVRMRVTVTSRRAFEGGSVRLVERGAALHGGAERVAFPARAAGVPADAEFSVRLPADATHALLQFQASIEGQEGLASRGATYLMLPDGFAHPGRSITTAEGRRLIDFAARRIGR